MQHKFTADSLRFICCPALTESDQSLTTNVRRGDYGFEVLYEETVHYVLSVDCEL